MRSSCRARTVAWIFSRDAVSLLLTSTLAKPDAGSWASLETRLAGPLSRHADWLSGSMYVAQDRQLVEGDEKVSCRIEESGFLNF